MIEKTATPRDGSQDAARTHGDAEARSESWGSFALFLLKLVLAVVLFRSFVFAPFTIPSESMLPQLENGDYIVAAKWPYGFSRLSLPFEAPLIPGRIFVSLPERGDVAIFKHPLDGTDYIKRVIGLPGDTVAVRAGRLVLNRRPVERTDAAPMVVRISPNTACHPAALRVQRHDGPACAYHGYVETLPNGRGYTTIDLGTGPADDYGPAIVPPGHLFVMGDNRDNSQDSRFAAQPGGGVGMVPADALVGRASMVLFSTDGSAEWIKPWTWFTAARWRRVGEVL